MTQNLLIATRAVHLAALTLLVGALAFALVVARPVLGRVTWNAWLERRDLNGWVLRIAGWSVLLAFVSGLLWLVLVAANMSGRALGEALHGEILGAVLARTSFGRAWELHLGLIALFAGYLFLFRHAQDRGWLPIHSGSALLGAGLIMSLAWAGHAAATEPSGRLLHLAADALHLLAAGVWLGALVPLACVLGRAKRSLSAGSSIVAGEVARRFSVLGLASVGCLLATGLVNAWFLVGSFHALLETTYGWLLLVKVALFLVMVAIAAVNRLVLTPCLLAKAGADGARRQAAERLRRNVIAEICLGAVIIVIVGALGAIPPGFHGPHHS